MGNVLQFPGKRAGAQPEPGTRAKPAAKPKRPPAPDQLYGLGDIESALQFAAYLDQDWEAVELLLVVYREFLTNRWTLIHLPIKLRRRCARYLTHGEELTRLHTQYLELLYQLEE